MHNELRKVAVLDDYSNVTATMADWSVLKGRADITFLHGPLPSSDSLVARPLPLDVICVMRERTPLPRGVLERLPKLELIVSTSRHASIDTKAAEERGIAIMNAGYESAPT